MVKKNISLKGIYTKPQHDYMPVDENPTYEGDIKGGDELVRQSVSRKENLIQLKLYVSRETILLGGKRSVLEKTYRFSDLQIDQSSESIIAFEINRRKSTHPKRHSSDLDQEHMLAILKRIIGKPNGEWTKMRKGHIEWHVQQLAEELARRLKNHVRIGKHGTRYFVDFVSKAIRDGAIGAPPRNL